MWLSIAALVICATCCLCYEGYEDTRLMARPYPAQKKIPFHRNIPILNAHKRIRSVVTPEESKRRNGKKPKVPWLKEGYTVFPTIRIKKIASREYLDSPFSLMPFPPEMDERSNKIHKKVLPDHEFFHLRQKRSAVAQKTNVSNKGSKTADPKASNKKNPSAVRSKSPKNKTSKSKAAAQSKVNKPAARAPANKAKPQKKVVKPQKQPAKSLARNKRVSNKNVRTNSKAKKAPKKGLRAARPRNKKAKSNVRTQNKNRKRTVNKKIKNVKRTQAQPQGRKVHVGRRLIAGRDALIEEYPYVVSIQKDGEHWCGGALLNPRLVITTANCVWKSERVSRLRVRAGTRHSDRGGQKARVQEMMRHPGWSLRRIPDNDVALLVLEDSIKFSDSVHAVDLPNRAMLPPFLDAWVTSWGSDRRDGLYDRTDLSLQSYQGHLMRRRKCNNITERFGIHVSHNFFCMTQAGKRAPCTRDTGAPAVSDGVLWGLASWGLRKLCGTERFPAMFTYIGSYSIMNFIENATRFMMAEERKYPFLDKLGGFDLIRSRAQNMANASDTARY